MKFTKRLLLLLVTLMVALPLPAFSKTQSIALNAADYSVSETGSYTSMEEVAVYISLYASLPDNYITKKQAQALGWDSRAGNLDEVAPGKSIGGDRFGNYEGSLPSAKGRNWTECDIDSDGGYRNGLRIVFSNDGLIYYTDDHYNSFREVLVSSSDEATADTTTDTLLPDGAYTARDDVAAYLNTYACLPYNYLTRDVAKTLGWSSKKNNLADVAPGYAIGGDVFGNREGLLPDASGRVWFECDVNGVDGKRSQERLVYSSDGLIYYTPDNHKHFERLY